MGVRRTVIALAILALLAGCGGGAKARAGSEKPAEADPADALMEQRISVPQPKLPPPIDRPAREDGAVFARYFVAGSLEYALRSGFTIDFRRDFSFYCERCRSVWKRIDSEYEQGHHIEMSPVFVDAIKVRRGPAKRDPGVYEPTYWLVDVKYHIDQLSLRDGSGVIESADGLEFVDRLVVSYQEYSEEWHIDIWNSTVNDRGAPILGRPAAA
jgi:hypothetical protein